MKTFWTFWIAATALAGAASPASSSPSIVAARPDAVYARGETAAFVVRVTGTTAQNTVVKWTLFKDGATPFRSGTLTPAGGASRIETTLDEPGFLLCQVECGTADGRKPARAFAGAGVSPLEIKPSLPSPADFDEFWLAQKNALQAVPPNLRVKAGGPAPSAAGIELLDVQADCAGGAPVSGCLARRAGAKPGSLPAILTLHGAGVHSAMRNVATGWAKDGFLALDINAHGLPNGRPPSFYAQLAKGALKDYRTRGLTSRETFYFRGMFLRVLRALDIIAAQPEWNRRTLVLYGTSQGGAQAIAGAALDARVTLLVAGVPAMCDHSGMMAGRASGWPRLVPVTDGVPDAAALATARYYDMVNFAARVRAPALFTVGFIDRTCPPATVYAAFNALPAPKEIFNDIAAGHENTPEAKRRMRDAVLRHAGLTPAPAAPATPSSF